MDAGRATRSALVLQTMVWLLQQDDIRAAAQNLALAMRKELGAERSQQAADDIQTKMHAQAMQLPVPVATPADGVPPLSIGLYL